LVVALEARDHLPGNIPTAICTISARLVLAQRDIPVLARIVAVADAFDSMTSGRAYRGAMIEPWAIQELHDHAGKQFDPEVVEAFVASRRNRPDG